MDVREDFPILKREISGKPLAYLDNAATTQKPRQVIEAISEFYSMYNSNIHRSIHTIGEEATEMYEDAHRKVSGFIGADFEELAFTKGTTESLNILAGSLTAGLKKGDEIALTRSEHHSNFVPWQQLAKKLGLKLRIMDIKEGHIDQTSMHECINKNTKVVSATHVSNVLGTVNDIRLLADLAHENDALFIADAAQSVPHMKVDVKKLGCDFLAFSAHKMLGPTGIGALYGKKELMEKLEPGLYGGEMISRVELEDSTWNELPWRFEAGTPNIAGAIGFGAAIEYLEGIGMDKVKAHGQMLVSYALDKLRDLPVEIYGPKDNRSALVSFNVKGVHAHDTAQILDGEGIAVRAGHHCAMPLASLLGISASVRASFYIYNTKEEIDRLAEGIRKVSEVFA